MLITISDQSQIAGARRAAASFTRELGFDDDQAGRVAIIATEMAGNIFKHGANGYLIIDRFTDGSGNGIELLAADKGPGIADIARALEDGFSTAGTPGTGLGAIRRQADQFDLYSRAGAGTVVMARIIGEKNTTMPERAEIALGQVVIPYPGEIECGDSWAFGLGNGRPSLLAVDGSGHGPQAATAARTAVTTFETSDRADAVRLMETMHRALAPTRGAAVAVAQIDAAAGQIHFVGVGNIAAAVIESTGSIKRMVSHNGTAGQIASRIREFIYPCGRDATVVLHSDGLSAKWDTASYPGLMTHHPSVVAGVLSRDFRRANDDAMVVVMRRQAQLPA
jgi:anti-sigma regulatory factor (Ser/Thr protein kinase)